MTTLAGAGATDVGRVRSGRANQDSYFVGDDLFVVCDGVGGHQGGEVASSTAVEAIRDHFNQRTLVGLIEAVLYANRKVWEKAQGDPGLRGMGTTVCAAALVEEDGEARVAVVNVGDSRGYLMRQGELSQLTEDHSLVEQMYREGRLSREEADVHPQRSLITRALGLDPDVEVDSWQILPAAGDRYLLCSDGLTNEVSDDRIAATLRRLADPGEAARELVRMANEAGGRDNITVVVVDVVDDDHAAEEASAALAAEPGLESHTADAPAEPEPAPAPAGRARQRREPPARPRRFTWRVALFLLLLLGVLGGAIAAVGWYARGAWYVGVDDGEVAIFQGRPGGLLWWKPTLEARTGLALRDVPESRRDDLERGHETADRAAADRYVANLRDEARTFQRTTTTSTTAAAPTTTLPPP